MKKLMIAAAACGALMGGVAAVAAAALKVTDEAFMGAGPHPVQECREVAIRELGR